MRYSRLGIGGIHRASEPPERIAQGGFDAVLMDMVLPGITASRHQANS